MLCREVHISIWIYVICTWCYVSPYLQLFFIFQNEVLVGYKSINPNGIQTNWNSPCHAVINGVTIAICHAIFVSVTIGLCHAKKKGVTGATQALHAGAMRGSGLAWHVWPRRHWWRDNLIWSLHGRWRDQKGQI